MQLPALLSLLALLLAPAHAAFAVINNLQSNVGSLEGGSYLVIVRLLSLN